MKSIYCISGLGADERAFAALHITGHKFVHLPWVLPDKKESIADYAKRMSEKITDENPILMGLSFGGMMCIEIAKLIAVEKVIIISSIKSRAELPTWMRTAGKIKLNKLLPLRPFKILEPYQNKRLGVKTKEEKHMVRHFRKNTPQIYTNWAINQILNWKNDWQPEKIFHIHGDSDKLFPIDKVKPNHIVKGGTHFMIIHKSEEVSRFINEVI